MQHRNIICLIFVFHFDYDFNRFEFNVFYADLHSLFTLVIFWRVGREGNHSNCAASKPEKVDGLIEICHTPDYWWFLPLQKRSELFARRPMSELETT